MPYYVYKIDPPATLSHLGTQDDYQAAREQVRGLRATLGTDDQSHYRMIFANHQAEAERLLSLPRDDRIIGED
ncbi:hypothetical protein ABC977_02625 [Thioalkalicoccus limnaeus]|uniref:GYD domain-containing protein n=1 Tax=Thioalkalicoccus limnaeus TaxID=120681 RepID=A0ABV4BA58_9GAMM